MCDSKKLENFAASDASYIAFRVLLSLPIDCVMMLDLEAVSRERYGDRKVPQKVPKACPAL